MSRWIRRVTRSSWRSRPEPRNYNRAQRRLRMPLRRRSDFGFGLGIHRCTWSNHTGGLRRICHSTRGRGLVRPGTAARSLDSGRDQVVAGEGEVTDLGEHRLKHFDPAGRRFTRWDSRSSCSLTPILHEPAAPNIDVHRPRARRCEPPPFRPTAFELVPPTGLGGNR